MLYYAGIGRHKNTPPHMLNIIGSVASFMGSVGWTLRSGGALECDTAFENGCDRVKGAKEIYLPWRAFNHNLSELNPAIYPFNDEEKEFTAKFHPAWNKCGPSARLMHTRNTRIMLGMQPIHGPIVQPVKFVICWTEEGKEDGGTGQALRVAHALNIPIINFGSANNPAELEHLVLEVERLQKHFDSQDK